MKCIREINYGLIRDVKVGILCSNRVGEYPIWYFATMDIRLGMWLIMAVEQIYEFRLGAVVVLPASRPGVFSHTDFAIVDFHQKITQFARLGFFPIGLTGQIGVRVQRVFAVQILNDAVRVQEPRKSKDVECSSLVEFMS